QGISYTAGVPAVAAAMLIADGAWDVRRMVNGEELDPKPVIELMNRMGLVSRVRDAQGDRVLDPNTEYAETSPSLDQDVNVSAACAQGAAEAPRSPRGVMSRSTSSNAPCIASASIAAGTAPCMIRPMSSRRMPVRIGWPKPPAPISAPRVAVPTLMTAAIFTP